MGVGLLNGQITKRDSMASEEGGKGLFTVNTTGVKDRRAVSPRGPGSYPDNFGGANKMLP
jgi:hypothetical protein